MPDLIIPVAVTRQMLPELLPKLANFYCGAQPWELEVSNWIRGEKMANDLESSLRDKTKVWLYLNQQREIVGFSSLGKTNWPYPGLEDPKTRVGIIPNLGVEYKFQGKPLGKRVGRYAYQIMDHVVSRARDAGYTYLGLFVHPANAKAIAFYGQNGFQQLPSKQDGYLRMVLSVPKAEPDEASQV